ncbi:antibiotic biosynthesis monooxygenase [uncultured Roseobacter sp.]|uniref:putative quinol monooxygenase n=1 Tax=uncultured Roseobacter sp. TaxID=114847 RepID=UPI002605FDD7|nr:antibiotic biosynthesis monooxygenase [uncultured Roseobacter sp.]
MSDTTIHVHLEVDVPAANAAGFKELMDELVERSDKEPGTLMYEWSEVGDTGKWHIHEVYANGETGDLHVKGFAENYAGRFFELVDRCTGIVSDNATPYIKGVLEGISPTYMSQKGGFNRF